MTISIPYSGVNLRKHLAAGRAALRADHARVEEELKGHLRAGSAGCIAGGQVYGECHRIAHARSFGADKPIEEDRDLMFDAGEGNEDLWEKVLVPGWSGQVLRKQHALKQGSFGSVRGRPDIVLADADGNWNTLLELKLVSATNSACYRHISGEADSKHLIQTGTYMWLTGKPAILCYTSRTDFAVEFSRKKFGVSKIKPFYRMFYVSFRNDRLYYRDEYSSTEVETNITGAGIIAYYQLVHDMAHSYQLHERPSNDGVDGKPAAWDRCDAKYCPFSEACERFSGDYASWKDAVTTVSNEGRR